MRPRRADSVRQLLTPVPMVQLGKAVVAGVGAKLLTGSIFGFILVFALIYWLL